MCCPAAVLCCAELSCAPQPPIHDVLCKMASAIRPKSLYSFYFSFHLVKYAHLSAIDMVSLYMLLVLLLLPTLPMLTHTFPDDERHTLFTSSSPSSHSPSHSNIIAPEVRVLPPSCTNSKPWCLKTVRFSLNPTCAPSITIHVNTSNDTRTYKTF